VHPIAVFFLLVIVGPVALVSVALWRFRRRIPGQRWGWERVAFAALVWVLATVVLGAAIGLHAFILAHRYGWDTSPWTAAPILLLALPFYALTEVLLCRWAMRPDPSAGSLSPSSRPVA
jgi:hypothetical protein